MCALFFGHPGMGEAFSRDPDCWHGSVELEHVTPQRLCMIAILYDVCKL